MSQVIWHDSGKVIFQVTTCHPVRSWPQSQVATLIRSWTRWQVTIPVVTLVTTHHTCRSYDRSELNIPVRSYPRSKLTTPLQLWNTSPVISVYLPKKPGINSFYLKLLDQLNILLPCFGLMQAWNVPRIITQKGNVPRIIIKIGNIPVPRTDLNLTCLCFAEPGRRIPHSLSAPAPCQRWGHPTAEFTLSVTPCVQTYEGVPERGRPALVLWRPPCPRTTLVHAVRSECQWTPSLLKGRVVVS